MNKEQKNMMTLYICFLISVIFNFIPSYGVQIVGFILFFITFFITYIYKYKSDMDSFQYSHTKYIAKTIWIFSVFLLIGIILAGVLADNSSINNAMDSAMNGVLLSEEKLETILIEYMWKNLFVFLFTITPSFIYFFYRLVKGIQLVKNNKIITNPKSWL